MKTAVDITLSVLKEVGVKVEAFAPFKPYDLQAVRLNDPTAQSKITRDAPKPPDYHPHPTDRYEYWDWLQEKTQERWAEMKQKQEERDEERQRNREEVLQVVEETWGTKPMVSLKAIDEEEKKMKGLSDESEQQ